MSTIVAQTVATQPKQNGQPAGALPKPNGDFYEVTDCLSDEERGILKRVRAFMETNVAPIINNYWAEDSFPFEIVPGIRDLNIVGAGYEGYGCPGGSTLLAGFIALELARVDCSCATFFWRTQRFGHGIDLSLRLRGTKAEMAAAHGAPRKGGLIRFNRASRRFGRFRWTHDDC
jgi:alkylation response protein AidB-like acyl-CoA dehydrogenase